MDTGRTDTRAGRLLADVVSLEQTLVGLLHFLRWLVYKTGAREFRRITARPVAPDIEEIGVAIVQLVAHGEPSPAPSSYVAERVAEIFDPIALQALHRQGEDIEIEHARVRSVHRRLCRSGIHTARGGEEFELNPFLDQPQILELGRDVREPHVGELLAQSFQ